MLQKYSILIALTLSSLISLSVLAYQYIAFSDDYYVFMVVNLFLAWIPLFCAIAAVKYTHRIFKIFFSALWLLFLPNAAYVLTDFMHLGEISRTTTWLDVLLIFSFSLTSLMLGSFSTVLMFHDWKIRHGGVLAWLLITSSSVLCAIGIYMGRFLRLNSWDALIHPHSTLLVTAERYLHPFTHPVAYPFTFFMTLIIFASFILTKNLLGSKSTGRL